MAEKNSTFGPGLMSDLLQQFLKEERSKMVKVQDSEGLRQSLDALAQKHNAFLGVVATPMTCHRHGNVVSNTGLFGGTPPIQTEEDAGNAELVANRIGVRLEAVRRIEAKLETLSDEIQGYSAQMIEALNSTAEERLKGYREVKEKQEKEAREAEAEVKKAS